LESASGRKFRGVCCVEEGWYQIGTAVNDPSRAPWLSWAADTRTTPNNAAKPPTTHHGQKPTMGQNRGEKKNRAAEKGF